VGSVHGVADGDVIIDARHAGENRLHQERGKKHWRRRLQLDQCILGVLVLGFFLVRDPGCFRVYLRIWVEAETNGGCWVRSVAVGCPAVVDRQTILSHGQVTMIARR
jgi:hypothetical protein